MSGQPVRRKNNLLSHREPILEALNVKSVNPRVLCIIPSLPDEVKMDTLRSIFSQTVPVACTILLTEKITEKLTFPAKISKVINNMLVDLKLENYDYLLRVDADVVLPHNFLEENLKQNFDVLGYGYAQLIKMSSFIKYMDGKLHPEHDDGYVLAKFEYFGLKSSSNAYSVQPIVKRKPGFHHGSSWFVTQGELHYRYGDEPISQIVDRVYGFSIYSVFEAFGYFKALLQRKERFDIAGPNLYLQLRKFRNPTRLFRLGVYIRKKIVLRNEVIPL
jgi:hypothetical protein